MSEIKPDELAAHIQRQRLAEHGQIAQDEAIARHYSKLAQLAIQLRKMCDTRAEAVRDGWPLPNEVDDSIARLSGEIRKHHLADFGVALEWNEEE